MTTEQELIQELGPWPKRAKTCLFSSQGEDGPGIQEVQGEQKDHRAELIQELGPWVDFKKS